MTPVIGCVLMARSELRDELLARLRDYPVRVFFEQPETLDWSEFLERQKRLRTDVLFVDAKGLPVPFEGLASRVKAVSPAPAIIALQDSADAETILQTLRAGADDFLVRPLDGGLRNAIEKVVEARAERIDPDTASGRLLGFVSAKGGCGATTVACHVALELRRSLGKEVLLADLDLDGGLVGFLTKALSPYSVLDAANNTHRLDSSYWKALVATHRSGVEVIPAPVNPPAGGSIDGQRLLEVMRFVRTHYAWVVTDLGNRVTPAARILLPQFDELFVVTTSDCTGLYQAKRTIQFLLDNGCKHKRLRLILNRVKSRGPTDEELEHLLSLAPYADLPDDPELEGIYAEGKMAGAESRVGRALTQLGRKVAGVPEENPKPRTLVSTWRAVFGG